MTQEDLAERADLSLGAIQLVESQKRWPERDTVSSIAKALGVEETALFVDPELSPSVKEAWEIITRELGSKLKKPGRRPAKVRK